MKTKVILNGKPFQLEIKVKDLQKSRSSEYDAMRIADYIQVMAIEASEFVRYGSPVFAAEYEQFAHAIYQTLNESGYYKSLYNEK